MFDAIITKYLGPTNTKGSRIKATMGRDSVTIPYPYELSGSAVHRFAAAKIATKMGFSLSRFKLIGAVIPRGYVFVVDGPYLELENKGNE